MKKFAAVLLILSLLVCSSAMAETDLSQYSITNANVTAVHFVDLTAPYSGTLKSFDLSAGDSVSAGDTLFSMLTTEIYAAEKGTITAMFAGVGSDASAVMQSYGSLGAMDPDITQRISCTTSGAYNDDDNKVLHVGETLYFKSSKSDGEKGWGTVISVTSSGYVVEIVKGSFSPNESMNMYRDDDYSSKECVGKGTVVQRNPLTFSGSGIVSAVYVSVGDQVSAHAPILSLMGADADPGASPEVKAPSSGVVSTIAVTSGQQVWKGELLCRLYLTDELEVTADVDEVDLNGLRVGDNVYVTLDTDQDTVLSAQVTEISALGITKSNAAYYTVHVKLSSTGSSLMLGQSASLYLPKK